MWPLGKSSHVFTCRPAGGGTILELHRSSDCRGRILQIPCILCCCVLLFLNWGFQRYFLLSFGPRFGLVRNPWFKPTWVLSSTVMIIDWLAEVEPAGEFGALFEEERNLGQLDGLQKLESCCVSSGASANQTNAFPKTFMNNAFTLCFQLAKSYFSRMRSKGSRFTLGVWGWRVCSLDVA